MFQFDLTEWWADYAPEYPSEDSVLEKVWSLILEEASESEQCTDEDGEWLTGFPEALEDMHHPIGKLAHEAMMNGVSWVQEANQEYSFYVNNCGSDPYSYRGVSRSDFA